MLKAIETRYKGYRFRSRLEARWAVFFDNLGLKWEYEPEGFETSLGPYLPDFFIAENHHYGPYVEIKGREPTTEEIKKLEEVCLALGSYGLLLWGEIGATRHIEIHKEYGVDPCPNKLPDLFPFYGRGNWGLATVAARGARFEHGERK